MNQQQPPHTQSVDETKQGRSTEQPSGIREEQKADRERGRALQAMEKR